MVVEARLDVRLRLQSRAGRTELRERVDVEHRLAHLANRQGPKACYMGTRRNVFDMRRLSAVRNLEVIARHQARGGGFARRDLTCSALQLLLASRFSYQIGHCRWAHRRQAADQRRVLDSKS